MLELSANCPASNYSHIVHSPEGVTSLAPQLNYLTDLVFRIKSRIAKMKAEVKEIKNQLAVTHLSLVNEIRHSNKSDLGISFPFQHKYPFQNPKTKNPFPVQQQNTQKEVEKSSGKELEKDGL